MNTIDDEKLLDRVRGAYADEVLRIPVTDIKGAPRAARRWSLAAAAAACAGVAVAVAVGTLVLDGSGPHEVASPPPSAEERCAVKVIEMTQNMPALPLAERGQVPATRLDMAIGADDVFLYATRHALMTCVAPPGNAAITIWVVPDGEELPPNKLQPHTWGVGEQLSWVGGTVPEGTQQVAVTLPSGRRVPAVSKDGVFLAAWSGEAAEPTRIEATTTTSTIGWGPGT